MTEKSRYSRIMSIAVHYLIFFALVAFLVTSTTSLFVHTLASSLEIVLTDSDLELAAKLTFANVIVLSVLLTVIDVIRRKLTIERTTRHITQAAKNVAQGDFSVRV